MSERETAHTLWPIITRRQFLQGSLAAVANAFLAACGLQPTVPTRQIELTQTSTASQALAVDDASGLNRTVVAAIVQVKADDDVRKALARARSEGLRVSLAGRRHTMGGHTMGPGHIILDMMGFDNLSFDAAPGILTAQAGATWDKVQKFLDPQGRSVKVMQSDNIFTIGGTLSANAHGWQPGTGPVASTVKSLKMMLPSGQVETCSREESPELFRAALGGYGLVGVILEAQLETVPNALYEHKAWVFPSEEYIPRFQEQVLGNPQVGLAYGRLSVDGAIAAEASLHVYQRVEPQPPQLQPMEEEGFVWIKRTVLRLSAGGDIFKRLRWVLENSVGNWFESRRPQTRNTAMNHGARVFGSPGPGWRYILHEYFIPLERFNDFLPGLRQTVLTNRQNLLNVTLRDVREDKDAMLAYTRGDVMAFVLLFFQEATPEGEVAMEHMTRKLVDIATGLGGTFYLPYRLHYTREQFLAAYPRAEEFLALKRQVDPQGILSSRFYDHIVGAGPAPEDLSQVPSLLDDVLILTNSPA